MHGGVVVGDHSTTDLVEFHCGDGGVLAKYVSMALAGKGEEGLAEVELEVDLQGGIREEASVDTAGWCCIIASRRVVHTMYLCTHMF